MKNTALLVIDMLNDYLKPEGLIYCEKCREIIPTISKCIEYARKNGLQIIYLNTSLKDENDTLVKKWGLHAISGSYGANVIDELKPTEVDLIIKKKSYNGFFNTNLDFELRKREITNIAITGIHTHVCVLITSVAAFELGYNVTVIEDAITTGNKENHESRLRFFDTHVGELISSEEWKKRIEIK